MDRTTPWYLARKEDEASRADLNQVVYYASESLRIISILLQPFMPTKAAQILDILGVAENRRSFDDAKVGADLDYGEPVNIDRALFPLLAVQD